MYPEYHLFTEQACRVLRSAVDEAKVRDHARIGTGHLLAALVREPEGRAAQVLAALGADRRTLYALVDVALGQGEQPFYGRITLSAQATRALDLAVEEAQALQQVRADTEHLLLGILLVEEEVGAQVLERQEVWLRPVHREIRRLQPS
jgi:ATP-dependent Clp protease ATP-binding subunit ClpC